MVLFYVVILILVLFGVSLRRNDDARKEFLSKDSSNAIKGVGILLVFLRHANQYVRNGGYDYSGIGDSLFLLIDSMLDQLIVIMFLFFSGYGVFCSIKKKGDSYVKSIPKHRILNTLVNFDIAVFFFIILAFIVGRELTLKQVLLSLIAWEDVGNSNWYIFVIFICYFSTWLAFCFGFLGIWGHKTNKDWLSIFVCFALILISIVFLIVAGKGRWWYDTILVYPMGMLYGYYKDRIYNILKCTRAYRFCLCSTIGVFIFSYFLGSVPILQFTGASWGGWILRVASAVSITLLIMMRLKVGNRFLIWCGINLFPLYIYQRLPMIIVSSFLTSNPFFLIIISFALTCAIAQLYKRFEIKL